MDGVYLLYFFVILRMNIILNIQYMNNFLILRVVVLILIAVVAACESPRDKELREEILAGEALIEEARKAYRAGEFEVSIELIDSVRKVYPRAMNAREEGILLKDSVELAKVELDLKSLEANGCMDAELWEETKRRLQFFVRKLQYDKERREVH